MKKIKLMIAITFTVWLSSCQKYLDEPDRVQADIKTVEQLQALLDNLPSGTVDWSFALAYDFAPTWSTDDTEINLTAYKLTPAVLNEFNSSYFYTFNSAEIATSPVDYLSQLTWKHVLNANVILSNVDNVTGSAESKNMVKANAYFNRAYAYWVLVNHYCQPYTSSTLQSLGLPIRKTTNYTESLKRSTLKETYDFILSDISQAQGLVTYQDVNPSSRWRISKTAIDAFLSRYYLFIGDYNASLQHANSALISANAKLVDFNTIAPATNPATYTINGTRYTVTYSSLNQYTAGQYYNWAEFFFTSFTSARGSWNASPDLVAAFDLPAGTGASGNDLRLKHFLPANGGLTAGWQVPGLYSYKFFNNLIPTGPTVAEVLLNKAEASARLGDPATAQQAVNTLRAKRFTTGYANLNLNLNTTNALGLVLQERRRELPFGFRWYDIRRFAYNETTADDVVVSHSFYKVSNSNVDVSTVQTYTLPVKSSHYMVPFTNIDIAASNGQLQQNTY